MSSRDTNSLSPGLEGYQSNQEQPQQTSLSQLNEEADDSDLRQPVYREICTTADFDKLVQDGDNVLERVEKAMGVLGTDAARIWLKDIDRVRNQLMKHKNPIIAVVGATGSGKSSLINCLLGMKLLPTNCFRACTAAVVEIALNDEPDGPLHRATIEFVSKDEWRKDLGSLLGDLFEPNGDLSKDLKRHNSEAAVAFRKIRAVYPNRCVTTLTQLDVEQLMEVPHVQNVLGVRKCVSASTPEKLLALIKRYVDSKEKKDDGPNVRRGSAASLEGMEYWPLIRKVTVHTQAPVLESGCVIVDLPGTGDSNEARASVAASYLQHCTAVWIVSPIGRAVDDGHARTLLDLTFKRQMFRDGKMDRITFVCSKIDDIAIADAKSNFAHDPDFAERMDAINARKDINYREIAELRSIISNHEEKRQCLREKLRSSREMTKAYKKCAKEVEEGKQKYPLVLNATSKRKDHPEDLEVTARKRSRIQKNSQPTAIHRRGTQSDLPKATKVLNNNSKLDTKRTIQEDLTQPVLTSSDIQAMLKRLNEEQTTYSSELVELNEEMVSSRDALANLEAKQTRLGRKEWQGCVLQRNRCAIQALQRDFVTGIQEMNRSETQRDDLNFDPSTETSEEEDDQRRVLPVYCVSSTSYQSLSIQQGSKSRSEKEIAVFTDLDSTGIPALAEHVREMGSKHLQQTANDYINEINRLLTSLSIWSSGVSSDALEESKIMIQEALEVSGMLTVFFDTLKYAFDSVLRMITDQLLPQVTNQLPKATLEALEKVRTMYRRWELYHYQTYRAAARRNGRYPERDIDFHSDLLEPFIQNIDPVWNRVLNDNIPRSLDDCFTSAETMVEEFRKQFRTKLISRGVADTSIGAFEEQANRFIHSLQANVREYKVNMQVEQREANRLFLPTIQKHMLPVYPIILTESGQGCFARMKGHMHEYISDHKYGMFSDIDKQSSAKLKSAQEEVQKTLTRDVLQSSTAFQNDCSIFAAQRKVQDFADLDADAQAAILSILSDVGTSFGIITDANRAETWRGASPDIDSDDLNDASGSGDDFSDREIIEISDNDSDENS